MARKAVHLARHHDVGETRSTPSCSSSRNAAWRRHAADAIAELFQQADADRRDVRIVFDQQHRAAAAGSRWLAPSTCGGPLSRGSRIVTSVPWPSSLAHPDRPASLVGKAVHLRQANPVPFPIGLVVKNGSKILSSTPGRCRCRYPLPRSRRNRRIGFLAKVVLRRHRNHAAVGHGVARIDHEIDERGFELGDVDHYRPDVRSTSYSSVTAPPTPVSSTSRTALIRSANRSPAD